MLRSPFRAKARCTCEFRKVGSWSAGYHTGEDWVCDSDKTLVSPADGVVVKSKFDKSYGNYIVIRTTNNNVILMAHMEDKAVVLIGQKVKAGDVVGKMGNSGHSSGAHLHIEYEENDCWMYNKNIRKPSLYIDFGKFGQEDEKVKTKVVLNLNGTKKTVEAVLVDGHYAFFAKDLKDDRIAVDWNNQMKTVSISAK